MADLPPPPKNSLAERFSPIVYDAIQRLHRDLIEAGCPVKLIVAGVCPSGEEAFSVVGGLPGKERNHAAEANFTAGILMAANGEEFSVVTREDVQRYARKFNKSQDYLSDFIGAIHYVLNGNTSKTLQGVNGMAKLRALHDRGFPKVN